MENYNYTCVGYKTLKKDNDTFYLAYLVETKPDKEYGRRTTTIFLADKPKIDKSYQIYFGRDYKARLSKT